VGIVVSELSDGLTVAFDATEEHVTSQAEKDSSDNQLMAIAITPNTKNARTAWKVLAPIVDFWKTNTDFHQELRHDLLAWMFGRPSVGQGTL
jgi:hypothetical protein